MADNYIEKKMESLRTGKTVFRRDNPSLDLLLRRISEYSQESGSTVRTQCQAGGSQVSAGTETPDALHTVKQAQIEAVLRSARLTGFEFEAAADEGRKALDLMMSDSSPEKFERLGEIIAIVRLKAAELGLRTTVETSSVKDKASATVHLCK